MTDHDQAVATITGNSGHRHDHGHGGGHGHTHGVVDPTIATTDEGIWALKWSFVGLFLTASLQFVVVILSGSVGLLADTIHNFGDAATAIPLWVAFVLARRRPSRALHLWLRAGGGPRRYPDCSDHSLRPSSRPSKASSRYLSSAGYFAPLGRSRWLLWSALLVTKRWRSSASASDARSRARRSSPTATTPGWMAGLASLCWPVWVRCGLVTPSAIRFIGLVITVAILGIVIQSGKAIFTRALDGTDPRIIQEIRHVAGHVPEVRDVGEVRARWLGHRLHVEANIAVDPTMSVRVAHDVANEFRHQLMHHLSYVSLVVVHIDPVDASGERHHKIESHTHDGLPAHSHA